MRSYTLSDLYEADPKGFTGDNVALKETLLDSTSNVIIQTAIMQRTNDSNGQFRLEDWTTVTAVRGNGRQQGFVSTPTKGIPNPLGYDLAQLVDILDTTWQGKDLSAALNGPRENFYASSSTSIVDHLHKVDGWHPGPDNSDPLANEVTHLLIAKFGQKLSKQMTNNLLQGRRSFICRQLHWVGGYSVDWVDGNNIATASIEPNIMAGILVLVRDDLDLSGNTPIYSAFGLTPASDFKEAMEMPPQEGAAVLAPYSNGHILHRSYTSMCTEVTLKTIEIIQSTPDLQTSIASGYRDFLGL